MALHLLYSDVHVKRETLAVVRRVFDCIGEQAVKLGVVKTGGYVLNNGDLFDQRGLIPTACWDLVVEARTKWQELGIQHIDNVGNHDQDDRDGEIHPLKIFESFGWEVCTKPTFIDEFSFAVIPYTHGLAAELPEAAEMKPKALFVHAGIKSAFRNDKSRDTDGISIELFAPFKRVFSGHYHFRHEVENVQYIGSTHQHTHAEAGQDKGFLIYNDRTGEIVFHEIPGTPKHYSMRLGFNDSGKLVIQEGKELVGELETCDLVKVHVSGRSDQVKMVSKGQVTDKIKHDGFTLERHIVDETVSRLEISNGGKALDQKDLISKYVNFIDPSLDKKKLVSLGSEFLGGH